jgi:hypothetical protein
MALVRTDVSEERFSSIASIDRISGLGTTSAITTFLRNFGLTRAIRHHIPENNIFNKKALRKFKECI